MGSQRLAVSIIRTGILAPAKHVNLARKLNLPIYQLLGGKVRDQLRVYAWIGGDRPDDVEDQA